LTLNVGDYVRTKKGTIYQFNSTSSMALNGAKKYMVKSSPNIIDLIEVGDILTIKDIFGNLSKVEVDENFKLLTGRIISIVTKEQFEQMEYKIN